MIDQNEDDINALRYYIKLWNDEERKRHKKAELEGTPIKKYQPAPYRKLMERI